MRERLKATRTPTRRALRVAIVVCTAVAVCGSVVTSGDFNSAARAQTPSNASGAQRFADLQELNNKLTRAIAKFGPRVFSGLPSARAALLRTYNDLEATKLRAVDQFPNVFGLPFGMTFKPLSCIDERIAIGKIALIELERGDLSSTGHLFVEHLLIKQLKSAKACKDGLEAGLGSGTTVPSGVSDNLNELNNKLTRAIAKFGPRVFSGLPSARAALLRTYNDLEATKLRAVEQFPEVIDPPYADIFKPLSCIDERIAIGKIALIELERGDLSSTGHLFVEHLLIKQLKSAKACKDGLEVELLHSFDFKTTEQTEVGVNQTTPNGADTTKPSGLNVPPPLEHAYVTNGFIGRHEHDYVATGVGSTNPDTWPAGRNVLFFDVVDMFNTTKGAQKVEKASEQNLRSHGFAPVSDSSLGSGEKVFQLQPPGSPLLSTIIYVQRGTFILKIAGSCKGCTQGSIESSLESLAKLQLAQAVKNGFPMAPGQSVAERWEFSGSGGSGQQYYSVCIYLAGPPAQTGDVKLSPGDATAMTDPNARTYDTAFGLDQNGNAFLKFTEPGDLFAFTISRKENNGSTSTSGSTVDPRIHQPPPWGLPDCTYP